MRISDWSSDVCSSDLTTLPRFVNKSGKPFPVKRVFPGIAFREPVRPRHSKRAPPGSIRYPLTKEPAAPLTSIASAQLPPSMLTITYLRSEERRLGKEHVS